MPEQEVYKTSEAYWEGSFLLPTAIISPPTAHFVVAHLYTLARISFFDYITSHRVVASPQDQKSTEGPDIQLRGLKVAIALYLVSHTCCTCAPLIALSPVTHLSCIACTSMHSYSHYNS